ncbi:unnamed protein product [Microthlaspi erraticum]|uniref:SWIM-type domain-containing protein n=1 Tax=Microthlaspi erraticum TaxID=1685480 RepID=A0A6D2K9J5_9BRAS|nr:unnamed protein product [Microthlaspi erraticum]
MDRSSYMREEFVEKPPEVEATQFLKAWEDGLDVSVLQEFPNKKAVQDAVDRAAFDNCFGFKIIKSDTVRYVVKCRQKSCKWVLRAAKITGSSRFSIRTHKKMHTCSRASQSTNNQSRKGTPRLVAAILHEDYPGLMETPTPKSIMGIVQNKLGLRISYSTALRGKNHHVFNLRGSAEDSYKKLYCYLHMLEEVNSGTVTSVKLDHEGRFHYFFVALGACIEGFKCMRKVITVDATHLKNRYGGVLVFASAQDPNRHNYPLAFAVLDGEKNDSWIWFFEKLKTIIPDSSELVFMSDRNPSLLTVVATVYPIAHHGYCIWHLSQNVKGRAYNANKDVVAWRFIECSRHYTIAEHEKAYSDFVSRYPSAAKYLVETTENMKHTWARCYFPGDRYNIDTSNCVESLNSTFRTARQYNLIPMLDAIIAKISEWFNDHRKEAAAVPVEHKLVPFVENFLHDTWPEAKKLKVKELNWFERLYDVIAKTDAGEARHYTVNLLSKSCSCRFFDIQKYPWVHALAAFIEFKATNEDRDRDIQVHELCSIYYWVETWQLAYYRTVYLVPDECQWNVPEYVKQLEIKPKKKPPKKGRKKVLRFPGPGERRARTKNKRRPRQGLFWLVTGRDGYVG